jgi:hypothetical protein
MDTHNLFLDNQLFPEKSKTAGTLSRMGDNVDLWPQEIMQEAYKQVPCLSDFDVNVTLDKVDEERGFAFGSLDIRPKTDMTQEEQEVSPIKKIHIPVLIKEQMLCPLDVFVHGKKYEYLTEGRLRAALFRPDVMDAPRERPPDPGLINQLQPPLVSGYSGMGGATKLGSLATCVPLLPQLHGRVLSDHVDRVKQAMLSDVSLASQVLNGDEGVKAAFASAINLEPTDPVKTAEVLSENLRPNVVQISRLDNGMCLVKWANTDMYAPQTETVQPQEAYEMMGGSKDMVETLERNGVVTLTPDPAVKSTDSAEEISLAETFGLWKVQDLNGNTLIGWVFPRVMSLDSQPLPLSLFNNGSQHALQEKIAGSLAGKSLDIPRGIPRGYGCLYFLDHGNAKAFIPMTVNNTYRGPDGSIKFMAVLDTGETVSFSFSDGLKLPVRVGEGDYVMPSEYNWMPLRGPVELVPEPRLFSKVAEAKFSSHFELIGDRDIFSYRGPAVAKLASDKTKFLNVKDAEFLGVALGMSTKMCKEAMVKAAKGDIVKLACGRLITPAKEVMDSARRKISDELDKMASEFPVHNYFLVKEAAMLDDALTADKILGLGFINAENVSTYVDMLPALEETSARLAELLVAVRLGIKDIPEIAVERMLSAMEDVITGLKSLKQKEMSTQV